MKVPLPRLQSTKALAARVCRGLRGRELLLLSGDLGAGKTTFTRYLAEALGIDPAWVSSPSFTLVQRYPPGSKGLALTHVDLYRIERPADAESLGLEEILAEGGVVVVEWPRAADDLWAASGRPIIRIEFGRDAAGLRAALVEAVGELGSEEVTK